METVKPEIKIPAPAPAAPGQAAAPRGRGRPPKSAAAPAQIQSPPAKAAASAPAVAIDRKLLAQQLSGLHAVLAMTSGDEIWNLSDQEASSLADGVSAVCVEYNLRLDGKTGAAIQLLAAAAAVYGTRMLIISRRPKKAKGDTKTPLEVVK